MPRLSLPQDYIKNQGNLIEDFETLSEWSTTGAVAISSDTNHFKTGTQSICFTHTSASWGAMTKTISRSFLGTRFFHVWVYIPTYQDRDGIVQVVLRLSSVSNFSKYMQMLWSGLSNLSIGWNCLGCHRDDFTNTGGESWANTMIRMRFELVRQTGAAPQLSFDSFYIDMETLPRCVIMFDDGYSSTYNVAYNYMQPRGLKGTVYMISDWIGTSGKLTQENLNTMYNAGWAIANHTSDHSNLSLLTQEQVQEKLIACRDALNTLGFTRSSRHVAYPYGAYSSEALAAMSACGMLTGRDTASTYNFPPVEDLHLLHVKSCQASVSLSTAKQWIDYTLKSGSTLCLLFHDLVESPSGVNWAISDFQALIDYIIARRLKCVTIDEWYEGLTNPRYRSVPLDRG
uniref:NodB homology domain-containing protein n=1 Tax=candidate division CPR3 bacterium TaxID=2268181 RepID=A0A7V3JAZ1_UNCC3